MRNIVKIIKFWENPINRNELVKKAEQISDKVKKLSLDDFALSAYGQKINLGKLVRDCVKKEIKRLKNK